MKQITVPIGSLKPADYNPREISNQAFEGLKESIREFGIVDPIIVNKDNTIIGGHMRWQASKALDIKEVPVVVLDLDKTKEKKLNVILNSQAISGTFDDLKLAEIMEVLKLEDNYEALMLDRVKPLDLSPTGEEEPMFNDYFKYELLFDSQEQQNIFLDFVNKLKKNGDDSLSIGALVIEYIQDNNA